MAKPKNRGGCGIGILKGKKVEVPNMFVPKAVSAVKVTGVSPTTDSCIEEGLLASGVRVCKVRSMFQMLKGIDSLHV